MLSIEIKCPVCGDLIKRNGVKEKGIAVLSSPDSRGEKIFVCIGRCYFEFKKRNPRWERTTAIGH